MNLYTERNLRRIIVGLVEERKEKGEKITFERLAQAAGVQKAHVTNVLKGRAHFQADQLYLIADALGLGSEERHYLLLLLEHERSVVKKRREELEGRISRIQEKHLKTQAHIQASTDQAKSVQESFPEYYLEPFHQILHVVLSIERFRKKPEEIAAVLGLPRARVKELLANLVRGGLIEKGKDGYQVLRRNFHLPRDTPIYAAWRQQLLAYGTHRSRMLPGDQQYGFSVVFSADEKARKQIQAKALEFIKSLEPLVGKAPAERVYQMNLDLLPWTEE